MLERAIGHPTTTLVILLTTTCLAASQQPPATEKEKRDAYFAYFSCLDAAASEMDDGRSDASTIALGVKSLCASQFAPTVELERRSLNPAARRWFESKVQNSQLEMATRAVLPGRANKRP